MKKVNFTNIREYDGLLWVTQTLDFGTSLVIRVATNEMNCCYARIKARRDLFHQKVKKIANNTVSLADKKLTIIRSNMANYNFFESYSDSITEASKNDITMYRLAVRRVFDDAGINDAELLSYIEVTRSLLEIARLHYKSAMEMAEARYLRWYNKEFREFDFADVSTAWEQLCDEVYPNKAIDLTVPSVSQWYNVLIDKFGSGSYVRECMKVACEENPEFNYNEIIIQKD